MGILAWCLFGAMAGHGIRAILPSPSSRRGYATVALGSASALFGGGTGAYIFESSPVTTIDLPSLLLATATSMVVLLAYRGFALRLQEQQRAQQNVRP